MRILSLLIIVFYIGTQINIIDLCARQVLPNVIEILDDTAFDELFNEIASLKQTRPHDAIELAVSYLNQPSSLSDYQKYSLLFTTGEAFAALDLSLTAIDVFTSSINYGITHLEDAKLASWYMELGNLYYREQDFVKADSIYIQCLRLYTSSFSTTNDNVDLLGAATALNNRALVKAYINEFAEAEALLKEALSYRLQVNKATHVAFNYISLASLYLKYTDSYEVAKAYVLMADSVIKNDINDKDNYLYRGLINEYLGNYSTLVKDDEKIVFHYKKAMEYYQKNETRSVIQIQLKLFNYYNIRNQDSEAWPYLEDAFELAKKHGSYLEQKKVIQTRIEWFKNKNDLSNSLKYAKELTALIENHVELEREVALKVGQLNRQVAQLDINLLNERNQKIKAEVYKNYAILALIIFFISGFIWYLKVQSENKNAIIIQKQKDELFQQELESEKWRSLGLQLKPHFLYNVLSSLRALIQIDAIAAVKMTEHLAKYFRQILDAEQTDKVKILSEIALCNEYLALQSIRFNNEIAYSCVVEESLKELKIPSMLIFPLIENAVKYGYKTHPNEMNIQVEVNKTDKHLRFAVINKGSWIEPRTDYKDDEYEGGLGFRNSKIRLMHHYGNDWILDQKEELGFVTIEVLINLDRFINTDS